jgi:Family of unknown function (DUF6502)
MKKKKNISLSAKTQMFRVFLQFIRDLGVKDSVLRQHFESFLGEERKISLSRGVSPDMGTQSRVVYIYSEVFRLWYRDSRYLTEEAIPKPLSLTGQRNSITSLVRQIAPDVDAVAAVNQLRLGKMVRQCADGKYVPRSRGALIAGLEPAHNSFLINSLSRLLLNFRTNLEAELGTESLISSTAEIWDLDPAAVKKFQDFSRQRGLAYLQSVDDWLHAHKAKKVVSKGRGSAARAGLQAAVHVLAYVEENPARAKRRKSLSVLQ